MRRAARWGRLWGYAPFSAPLASPPKHPQRTFSTSTKRRGHASYAAGASLTRYARSGDLPPRRVNATHRFRSGCFSVSAKSQQNFLCVMPVHLSNCTADSPWRIQPFAFGLSGLYPSNATPNKSGTSCIFGLSPFAARHQKQVVGSPSLTSPDRSEGDGWCWVNLQNTHFSGLTRKNAVFKRSVLKYVSIKNSAVSSSKCNTQSLGIGVF